MKYKAPVAGPWQITDTVHPDRKNLFCLAPRREHHIGTIVSGSRTKLERFGQALQVIEAAPEMCVLLTETVALLELHGFVQSPRAQDLSRRIRSLLGKIHSLPGEINTPARRRSR